jgi:hypothetical protein
METPGGSIPMTRRPGAVSGATLRPGAAMPACPARQSDAGDRLVLETAAAREKAEALLRGLLRARAAGRRHLRIGGERTLEPGSGGIDHAIESTRRMVGALERAMCQLRHAPIDELEALFEDDAR